LYGRAHQLVKGKYPNEKQGLIVGRSFTVVFLLAAAGMAPVIGQQESMYVFIQTALSMFQGPVFAILLIGILWGRATQWGGLAGLILGVTFTTILKNTDGLFPSDDPFLFISWWSFVFSSAVTIIVSLLTPKEPDEKLRGLVFGQIMKDGKIQRVLLDRVE
jgi:Na+/proline symporter